jgi:hypothetical protein
MNMSAQMKEQMIQNYVLKIDFSGDFSVSRIKNDLKGILHETPAVEVRYKKDKLVTEDLKGNKVVTVDEKVKSIVIAFSDGVDAHNRPIVHRVEFYA